MSLDTTTLQSFISIAETGSFTTAALLVGRTQSAISQQIAKLETLLNKPLFLRGKTFGLTPDGEIFFSYARQILALQNEALDRVTKPELEGEIRFGIPESFATLFLSDILAEFSLLHPRILLNIECGLTLNLFEGFKQNKFDIVIMEMNIPDYFPNGVNVWSEPLKWVGKSNIIDENKPVPLILAPHPSIYRTVAIKALESRGIPWRLVLSSSSHAAILAAVRSGMGVTVMTQRMITKDLSVINMESMPSLADTHISLLKNHANNQAINSLEEFILKRLK